MQLFSEKFLVIDYGSTFLKGALLQSGGGGTRILRLESLPVVSLPPDETAQGESVGEYEYNVIRFVQSFFPEEQNFVLNLPLDRIYVRDVRVPAVNQKQVGEIMIGEVEGVIPIPLDEAEVIGQPWDIRDENSHLITFTARHENLAMAVRPLLRTDTAIRMLSVDAVGLAGFVRLLPAEHYRNRTLAQIDIGGQHTIFNVVQDGKLVFTRQLPVGGQQITDVVEEKLALRSGLAAQKKIDLEIDLGYDDERAGKPESFFKRHRVEKGDYKKIVRACREVFDELAGEIERSLLALPCEVPRYFYLSGGGGLLGGVREFLAERLDARVEYYPLVLGSSEPAAQWATVLGTAEHYRLKSADRFDFLNSAFGNSLRGGSFNLGVFSTPILFVSASIIVFLVSLILSIYQDRRQIQQYQSQVAAIAQSIPLPPQKSVPAYIQAAQRMCQERLQGIQGDSGGTKVLDVMKALSELTPGAGEVDFRFSSLQYEGRAVQIVAEMADITQAASLEERYKTSQLFSSVEVLRRNILPNKRVRMTLKLTLNRAGGPSGGVGSCR